MNEVAVQEKVLGPRKKRRSEQSLRRDAIKEVQRLRATDKLGSDPIELLQELLDVAASEFRVAQQRTLELKEKDLWKDTIAGKIPNEWIRLRDDYFQRLQHLTERMVALGIADRQVKVQEAQALMVAQEVIGAAEEAGLSRTQIRSLGAALRRRSQDGPA